MADVDINKFRASVVREGSKPASPGFIVSEGQSPTDPAGSGQNHLPVTIATAATGLSITESQVLGGAGTVGQYIRGDGSLADFPESSGGGSSVSYYLNGSVSQGTIGGVAYKELNKVPILGAGTDFTINADGYIASFITDAGDPNLLEIPGGNWNFETYFSASSSGGTPSFYVELYKYDGSTFTLIASSSSAPEFIAFGTITTPYFSSLAVPTTTLALTDRLAVRYYVTHSGRTITLHTENNHLCQIITTFTTGITALNGLTAQVQNFAVGTTGTDFNIASAVATHTFNLPDASATARGVLTTGAQIIAGAKTFNSSVTANSLIKTGGTSSQFLKADGSVDSSTYLTTGTAASTYVPYTGATGNVDLGTRILSANNLIANGGFNSGALLLKQSNNAQGINVDYTTITPVGTTQLIFGLNQSSGVWKSFVLNAINLTNNTTRTYTLPDSSGTIALVGGVGVGTVTSVGLSSATSGVTIGSTPVTTSGTITLAIATASGSQNGLLSSTDWTTFNSKQNALTNPVTGTGTINYLARFTALSTIGTSSVYDTGSVVGIGNTGNASYKLLVTGNNASVDSSGNNTVYLSAGATESFLATSFISGGSGAYVPLSFETGGSKKMTLFTDGNLLLQSGGTFSNNGARLQVSGTATVSGNVGIGGGTPSIFTPYSVATFGNLSTTNNGITIASTTTGNGLLEFADGSGGGSASYRGYIQYAHTSDSLIFGTAGSDRLTLASTGAATFASGLAVNGGAIQTGLGNGLTIEGATYAPLYLSNSGTLKGFLASYSGGVLLSATSGFISLNNGGGNVLIGTTTDNGARLQVSGSAGGQLIRSQTTIAAGRNYLQWANGSGDMGYIGYGGADNKFYVSNQLNEDMIFATNNSERMRITSAGYSKFSNNGSYLYLANAFFEVNQSIADWTQVNVNKVSSGSPLGIYIGFSAQSPNNTSSLFILAQDSTVDRFAVRSNGGIANYQANNVNLSDIRTKKEIEPLESYWNKFKDIEIVKFKYKDQTHEDFNIGVIAQQVEKIAPEFIDFDGFGQTPINEQPLKSVYSSDLQHAAIKVLQEAMLKIESMQKEIDTLKN